MTIDKSTSLRMRGMAIILICLHNLLHLGCYVQECEFKFHEDRVDKLFIGFSHGFWSSVEYVFSYWGWYGVPVFLFLSGYGLTCKHELSGQVFHPWSYLCRNFKKLFLLLAPAFVLFVTINYYLNDELPLFRDVLGQLTLTLNLYDARAIVPGVYWYFGVTMQLYIIYILFYYKRSNGLLIGLSALSLLIGIYFAFHEEITELHFQIRHNSPLWLSVFTLGIWTARQRHSHLLCQMDRHWLITLPILLVLWLYSSVSALLWVISPLLAVAILLLIARHWRSKVTTWLGGISAGVFVCHPILRVFALKGFEMGYNHLAVCVLYVLLSIAVAMGYMRIYRHADMLTRHLVAPLREQWPMMITLTLMLCTIRFMNLYDKGTPDFDTPTGLTYGFMLTCLIAYLTVCFVHATHSRLVKALVYILHVLYFLVCVFLWRNFDTTISPSILTLMAETTPQESGEFLHTYLLSTPSIICYVITLTVIVMILTFELRRKGLAALLKRKIPSAACTLLTYLILTTGIPATYIYYQLFRCDTTDDISLWRFGTFVRPVDTISELLYSCYDIHLASTNTRKAIEATQGLSKETISCTESDSLHILVVIGESHIKHHSHLYGYPLQTTPRLETERNAGNLYVFTDAVSPYNMTSDVMKNLICTNSIWRGEHWYDYPTFPAVFKKAGYHVCFWDNQRNFDTNSEYTFALNSFLFNEELSAASYDETNKKTFPFDQGIIQSFFSDTHAQSPRQLSIVHLMGQHFTAKHRYPHSHRFYHFRSDSIDSIRPAVPYLDREKRQMIAEYDNATLYNDEMVWTIMDHYRTSNAVVIYFSDHGEELYDYRDHKGRAHGKPDAMTLRYQYEVPFVVWLSDTFRTTHPDIAASIANAVDQPLMLDNVCQMLFHIGGVKSRFYHAECDVTSDRYSPRRRLMRDEVYYEDFWR